MFRPPERFSPFLGRRGVVTLILLLFPTRVLADPSPSQLADNVSKRASAGKPLRIDSSLARAAEHHAVEILTDPARATRTQIQQALAREGLADAQILPFSSLGDDPEALVEALLAFADRAKARGATHLGLSFAKKDCKSDGGGGARPDKKLIAALRNAILAVMAEINDQWKMASGK